MEWFERVFYRYECKICHKKRVTVKINHLGICRPCKKQEAVKGQTTFLDDPKYTDPF